MSYRRTELGREQMRVVSPPVEGMATPSRDLVDSALVSTARYYVPSADGSDADSYYLLEPMYLNDYVVQWMYQDLLPDGATFGTDDVHFGYQPDEGLPHATEHMLNVCIINGGRTFHVHHMSLGAEGMKPPSRIPRGVRDGLCHRHATVTAWITDMKRKRVPWSRFRDFHFQIYITMKNSDSE